MKRLVLRIIAVLTKTTIRIGLVIAFLVFSLATNFALLASDALYDAARAGIGRVMSSISARPAPRSRAALEAEAQRLQRDRDLLRQRADALEGRVRTTEAANARLTQRLDGALVENRRLTSETAEAAADLSESRALRARIGRLVDGMSARTTRSITANFGSMAAEAAPYIGATAVVGVTFYEVRDACQTLREMRELTALVDGREVEDLPLCGYSLDEFVDAVFGGEADVDCSGLDMPPEMTALCLEPPKLDQIRPDTLPDQVVVLPPEPL